MGFFDKIFKSTVQDTNIYAPASEHEAWVGILTACTFSDGKVTSDESEMALAQVMFHDFFKGQDIVAIHKKALHAALEMSGIELVQLCAKHISDKNKETVFIMSVKTILIDGLGANEKAMLEAIATELGLTQETVNVIINEIVA